MLRIKTYEALNNYVFSFTLLKLQQQKYECHFFISNEVTNLCYKYKKFKPAFFGMNE